MTELERALDILRRGGVVAIPTETVYGLAANASDELAVRRIFSLKGRPSTHPLIVHVSSLEAARTWTTGLSAVAERLATAFWPGPLTLIAHRSSRASDTVTGGQDTVGLRVPAHPLTLELLRRLDGGLAAPSANRFGRVSPTTAQHVRSEFGDELELVLDGGPCQVGVESTIVDVSGDRPRLLRPGGVSREALEQVVGLPLLGGASNEAGGVRAPGMLASHYAPRAGLRLVPKEQLSVELERALAAGQRVAALVDAEVDLPSGVGRLVLPRDPAAAARVLYARLREADEAGYELLIGSLPEREGLGLAVADRLARAAAPRPR